MTKLVKGTVRVSANVATLGTVTALRKKCGVCGHPLTDHTGQVVAVTNQQPTRPIVVAPIIATPPVEALFATYPSSPPQPPAIKTGSSAMSLADELKKLAELRDAGVLSDDEFATQKSRLLG